MNEARMCFVAFVTGIALTVLYISLLRDAFFYVEDTQQFIYRVFLLAFSSSAAGIGVAFVLERTIKDAVVLYRMWRAR